MKIKIIDLLVKISKGEKPFKHIKYNNLNLYWNDEYCTYDIKEKKMYAPFYMFDYSELNNEVEIIEEPKKIEKISWGEKESLAGNLTAVGKQGVLARRTEKLKASLNELINEINNLKEDK